MPNPEIAQFPIQQRLGELVEDDVRRIVKAYLRNNPGVRVEGAVQVLEQVVVFAIIVMATPCKCPDARCDNAWHLLKEYRERAEAVG